MGKYGFRSILTEGMKMHLSSRKIEALGWRAKTELTDMFRFMAQDLAERNG